MEEPIGYQFTEKLESTVYGQMVELFGHHAGDFFLDACRIYHSSEPWATGSHLTGHLIRELDSMLRAGLLPIDYKPADNDDTRSQILAIADVLSLDKGSPLIPAWLKLKPHALAHRSGHGFSSARPIDQNFKDWWGSTIELFHEILNAYRDKHLLLTASLESLARTASPTKTDAVNLMKRLSRNPVLMHRVLSQINDPAWLPMLLRQGLFDIPNQGHAQASWWPPAQLLARLAKSGPNEVSDILDCISWPPHPNIFHNYLDAITHLPIDRVNQFTAKLCDWLDKASNIDFGDDISTIIIRLANEGHSSEAIKLFDSAIDWTISSDKPNGLDPGHPDTVFCDSCWYCDLVTKCLPSLIDSDSSKLTKVFLKHLTKVEQAIINRYDATPTTDHDWILYHYCEDVTDSGEFCYAEELYSLLDGYRQCLEKYFSDSLDRISDHITAVQESKCSVAHRCIMVALAHIEGAEIKHALYYLLDQDRFLSPNQQAEYRTLLSAYFSKLNARDQAKIIYWSLNPPDDYLANCDVEELQKRTAIWIVKHLQPIQGQLSGEARNIYQVSVSSVGAIVDRIDNEHKVGVVRVRGPKTVEQLAELSFDDAIEFVENWEPSEEVPFYIKREGLLADLQEAVAQKHERYIAAMPRWVDARIDLRSRILSGIVKAARDKREIDWDTIWEHLPSVLRGCGGEISQNGSETKGEHTARWIRQETATLIALGLTACENEIKKTTLRQAWEIIKSLVVDTDPGPDRDQRESHPFGAYSQAINSVAGVAWGVAIDILKHAEKCDDAFQLWGEIFKCAESYLAEKNCWRQAIHAMMGRVFLYFHKLDKNRADKMRPQIFPLSLDETQYFQAAWEGLALHWNLGAEGFKQLRTEYRHAINLIDPDESGRILSTKTESWLAIDLLSRLCSGTIDYDDSDQLIKQFELMASPELIHDVVSALGRTKLDEPESEQNKLWASRAMQFIDKRMTKLEDKGDVERIHKEFSSILDWLENDLYDPRSTLTLAYRLICNTKKTPKHCRLVRKLKRHVEMHCVECVQIIEAVLDSSHEIWDLAYQIDDLNALLRQLYDNRDSEIKVRVTRIVNRLSVKGIVLPGWFEA